jgi:hypothetical protein
MDDGQIKAAGFIERFAGNVDGFRKWFSKAWKIGSLMTKGAYLVGERKRLFTQLGEEVYYKVVKGELQNAELEPIVHKLDRLTKKVEIEEILIRSMRFGGRPTRSSRPSPE